MEDPFCNQVQKNIIAYYLEIKIIKKNLASVLIKKRECRDQILLLDKTYNNITVHQNNILHIKNKFAEIKKYFKQIKNMLSASIIYYNYMSFKKQTDMEFNKKLIYAITELSDRVYVLDDDLSKFIDIIVKYSNGKMQKSFEEFFS